MSKLRCLNQQCHNHEESFTKVSNQTSFAWYILIGNILLWVMWTFVKRSSFLVLISYMLSLKIIPCPLRRSCLTLKKIVLEIWNIIHINTSFYSFFLSWQEYISHFPNLTSSFLLSLVFTKFWWDSSKDIKMSFLPLIKWLLQLLSTYHISLVLFFGRWVWGR